MGLISKTVKIKWNPKIKKHYEELGYVYTKMGNEFKVKVKDLTKNSFVKIKCICDNCNEILNWTYCDYNRYVKEDGKTYCNKCANKLYACNNGIKTKTSKSKSFYDWCIENNRQDVLDRWDYELNDRSPKDICYSTHNKYWFKCDKHKEHESELKNIRSFVRGQEGSIECNQCKSIGQYIIDNYEEEFLWKVWSGKNAISPFKVLSGSHNNYFWNCIDNKHKEFKRNCKDSKKCEFRCPKCVEEKDESLYEEKVTIYLKYLGYNIVKEYNCSLIIYNPKTKCPLPFDNEIILSNGKHLIIEVHGEQHYIIDGYYIKTEEELHKRKLYDRYKRIKCIQEGYEYLEIPYTAFDKKDTYKKLINDKIFNIINKE